jgi:DNA-binding NtrC family response regulator
MKARSGRAPDEVMRVLVVDDDDTFRFLMEKRLQPSGHSVECVPDGKAALKRLAEQSFDVMLLDLSMPGLGGLEVLRRFEPTGPPCEVVVLTGHPDYADCVEAMNLGAINYVPKPMEASVIEETLRKAVQHGGLRRENAALRRMLGPAVNTSELVGGGPTIRAVLALAQKAAASDCRVVILGESGSGKGVVARRIHDTSRRRRKPFLAVHCGAMAHELLESELFGHERGAFTGAMADKLGLFELADGGTLFLDEFADMSAGMQSKLLKVLDAGELRRVGGVRTIRVDVRVIVATNSDVDELVRSGRLRLDLLHRVDVIRITLPALRERPEDLPALVAHFLAHHRGRGLPAKEFTTQAMRVLQRYSWPGNVRELANTIEHLAILAPRSTIDVADLPENIRSQKQPTTTTADDRSLTLAEVERRHVLRVLDATGGNLTAAARQLQVDRGTLHRKVQQWHKRETGQRSA